MMKALSTCVLTALMPCMAAPADTALPGATPLANVDKKMPMLELLPVGSVLTKVSVPQYEGPRLSLLLTAVRMTVAAPQEIAGHILNIYLYGRDGQMTHLFSGDASYFLDRKLIVSREETTIREKDFSAEGTGLYLDTDTKRGILLGPVKTIIHMDTFNK